MSDRHLDYALMNPDLSSRDRQRSWVMLKKKLLPAIFTENDVLRLHDAVTFLSDDLDVSMEDLRATPLESNERLLELYFMNLDDSEKEETLELIAAARDRLAIHLSRSNQGERSSVSSAPTHENEDDLTEEVRVIPNPGNQQQGQRLATLYVGDLSSDVSEPTLFDFFSKYGQVASVRVCRDMNSQSSLGYGYVNFVNHDDAARALETLNYTPLRAGGRPMRL
eukprot:PhF_6_TR33660/c1_g1_i3/m.49256